MEDCGSGTQDKARIPRFSETLRENMFGFMHRCTGIMRSQTILIILACNILQDSKRNFGRGMSGHLVVDKSDK